MYNNFSGISWSKSSMIKICLDLKFAIVLSEKSFEKTLRHDVFFSSMDVKWDFPENFSPWIFNILLTQFGQLLIILNDSLLFNET